MAPYTARHTTPYTVLYTASYTNFLYAALCRIRCHCFCGTNKSRTRIVYRSPTNRIRCRIHTVCIRRPVNGGSTVYDAVYDPYTIRVQLYTSATKTEFAPYTVPYTRRTKFRTKSTLRIGLRNIMLYAKYAKCFSWVRSESLKIPRGAYKFLLNLLNVFFVYCFFIYPPPLFIYCHFEFRR